MVPDVDQDTKRPRGTAESGPGEPHPADNCCEGRRPIDSEVFDAFLAGAAVYARRLIVATQQEAHGNRAGLDLIALKRKAPDAADGEGSSRRARPGAGSSEGERHDQQALDEDAGSERRRQPGGAIASSEALTRFEALRQRVKGKQKRSVDAVVGPSADASEASKRQQVGGRRRRCGNVDPQWV